jgi:hypothetical protein
MPFSGILYSAESFDFPHITSGKFSLFHEYLSKIKAKFANIFGFSSGPYGILIHEKTETKNLVLQSL